MYSVIGFLLIILIISIYLDNKKFNKHLNKLRTELDKNNEYYSTIYNKDGSIMYYEFNSRQGMYKHMNDIIIYKACHIKDEYSWFFINNNNTFIHFENKLIELF